MNKRNYHGWVLVEPMGPGLNDRIYVEYGSGDDRTKTDKGYGNSGCAAAIEWWEKKLGQPIKLEPTIKGCYRVYTEEGK